MDLNRLSALSQIPSTIDNLCMNSILDWHANFETPCRTIMPQNNVERERELRFLLVSTYKLRREMGLKYGTVEWILVLIPNKSGVKTELEYLPDSAT